MWWSKVRYLLLGLLASLIVIQFFPASQENPEVNIARDFIRLEAPDASMAVMIKGACYDCHSHETTYPWYARVQPLGWWLRGHIMEGREHLNFSTWGDYNPKKRAHKIEECIEWVEDGRMPLKSYTWTHKDAVMDNTEVKAMVDWFKSL